MCICIHVHVGLPVVVKDIYVEDPEISNMTIRDVEDFRYVQVHVIVGIVLCLQYVILFAHN